MPSISLCGDIVEFIVGDFWIAYEKTKIPAEQRKTPSDSTLRNLGNLKLWTIIDEQDYDRLHSVRKKRDDHVHYYTQRRLLTTYTLQLRKDNLDVLKKLIEFFAKDNMESKYHEYLDWAETAKSQ